MDFIWGEALWGESLWGYAPEAKALQEAIKGNKHQVFRRLYMKRRESTGEYESDWQRIPDKYVQKFGSVDYGVDDIKVNFYRYSGMKLVLDNIDGYFSEVTDARSFFYNKMTRFRTLVKVNAGYIYDGAEYPTNSTLFVGFIADDMPYRDTSLVECELKHLTGIFEEFPAGDVSGMGSTQTAQELFITIRDHADSNSTYYFQKFITSADWYIATTTTYYDLATTSSLDNTTVWDFMVKLAEAENKLLYVNRTGYLYFKDKTIDTATTVWHFSGVGDTNLAYGKNILKQISIENAIRKVYNRIRIKFADADTNTSYVTVGETWNWGDSSSSFIFGVRTYEYENDFLVTDTAQTIANNIFNEYYWPKKEIKLTSKFLPQLDINDYCTLTYITTPRYSSGALWGYFNWGEANWGKAGGGYNINVDNEGFSVLSIKHDLDKFTTEVVLREA